MPDEHVIPATPESDTYLLAERFQVSEPAMAWRLYNSGLGVKPVE